MDWKLVKPWLPFAALLLAIWLGGYMFYWLERNACSELVVRCFARAFGDWLGDLVMLQWVERFQTLIAGFLAFGAGVFVLTSYRAQRRDLMEDRATERRENNLASLHAVRHQANVFHSQLLTNATDLGSTLEALRVATLGVASFAPGLGYWVVYVAAQIEDLWGNPNDDDPGLDGERQRITALELSALMVAYLENIERLLGDDGRFQNVPAPRSAAGIYDPARHPIMAPMFNTN